MSATTFVIFGASGDLTQRKLIPALFAAYANGRLPEHCPIVGFARSEWDDKAFRQQMQAAVQKFAPDDYKAKKWQQFAKQLHYLSGDLTVTADFERLQTYLATVEGKRKHNRVYYCAIPPGFYEAAVTGLANADMVKEDKGWRRLVVEKPFGHDLASAQALNQALQKVFREEQIFRIDHYLGKETAQNILFLRFANAMFEPLWNHYHLDNVQISVTESVDVGQRAGYYEGVGAVRDMMQSHLLQLLALIAMEPAATYTSEAVRHEKVKVLQAVRPIAPEDTVRGQYKGYRQAEGVAPDSDTATYAAFKLYIDNWRWHGVPFYLRTGKALTRKNSEIALVFKQPPHLMFPEVRDEDFSAGVLSLCIQPDEGIHWQFESKVPGVDRKTQPVDLEFHYRTSFGDKPLPDAYQQLLLNVIEGDATFFTREDSIEAAWDLVDPVLASWTADKAPLTTYESGSWGPQAAEDLLAKDGRIWRNNCGEHETS